MTTYTLEYPPAQSDTYVKATTKYDTSRWPYYATDPAKTLTGAASANSWLCLNGTTTNQRFHIDLGSELIIRRIYYENFHSSGGSTNAGGKNIIFQGSNSAAAFAELTYATDTNWTALTLDASTLDQHVALDQVDPKYILVANSIAYRYYALKIANNYDNANYMGLRRIVLQTEDGYSPPASAFTPKIIMF